MTHRRPDLELASEDGLGITTRAMQGPDDPNHEPLTITLPAHIWEELELDAANHDRSVEELGRIVLIGYAAVGIRVRLRERAKAKAS